MSKKGESLGTRLHNITFYIKILIQTFNAYIMDCNNCCTVKINQGSSVHIYMYNVHVYTTLKELNFLCLYNITVIITLSYYCTVNICKSSFKCTHHLHVLYTNTTTVKELNFLCLYNITVIISYYCTFNSKSSFKCTHHLHVLYTNTTTVKELNFLCLYNITVIIILLCYCTVNINQGSSVHCSLTLTSFYTFTTTPNKLNFLCLYNETVVNCQDESNGKVL